MLVLDMIYLDRIVKKKKKIFNQNLYPSPSKLGCAVTLWPIDFLKIYGCYWALNFLSKWNWAC